MARPLRIELAGALYHVTSRGDRREPIYLDDQDRELWLDTLAMVCERFNWRVHAYCLMTNHYHIVVETPEANLSKGMRQLNGVYTQRFNQRHQMSGHLFQGRFKGILVERDAYLLELGRYVVLNPVRAQMVDSPESWPWSSYLAMVGLGEAPSWLETDWLLGQFGKQRQRARQKYAQFVAEGVGVRLWDGLRHQAFLGSDEFVARHRVMATGEAALREVPRAQRRALVESLDRYLERYPEPAEAMTRAYLAGGFTMKAIGEHFGVHYSSVSRYVKAFEQRNKSQPHRS